MGRVSLHYRSDMFRLHVAVLGRGPGLVVRDGHVHLQRNMRP